MINKHLNDDEIQQYVLQKANCDVDVLKHIEDCETCKIKAEQYNLLFEGIKEQEQPVFDCNIADLVIAQLPQSEEKASTDKLFFYWIIFICVVFLSIVSYLFKDSLSRFFKGITPIVAALTITTVTCLFVILCVDMYRKYQAQMKALNFN
jgi:hypothetical protein